MNSEKLIKLFPFYCILMIAVIWMGGEDQQDEINQQKRYCEMVKLWNDNDHLPKEDRPGWPPYKGECHED